MLIKYSDGKDTFVLDIKLGHKNEEQDKIEFMQQLIRRILCDLTRMSTNSEDDCYMKISDLSMCNFSSEATNNKSTFVEFYPI